MVRTRSLRPQSARHRVDHGTICGRSCANSGHHKPLCACVDRTFVNPNSSGRLPENLEPAPRPALDKFCPFANTPSDILISLVGNWNHRTNARLASQPSELCPKQQLGINAVRLRAAHTTIDWYAGRLDNVHFHLMPRKPSREPEA